MIKTYLRQSHECRTIIARIIGELELEFAHVAPHSRDIRETLTRCSPDEIANIDYQQPPHERRATVARISCNSRTIVLREMINQEINAF